MPSQRYQRWKYEWEKVKISATAGAVRADLFHGDSLFLTQLLSSDIQVSRIQFKPEKATIQSPLIMMK